MESMMLKGQCGFALLIFLAGFVKGTQSCTQNQYKKVSPSESVCVDCPKCPAGYGLSIQCGTNIPMNARIECVQCAKGVNYSAENDFEQCQPCGVCSQDQAMTQCTSESNTVCHHKCKSKENYYEQSSDDCQKCSWCCGDGNDIQQDECLKKGMPSKQSCTVHRKKTCTPAYIATTSKPTLHQTVTNPTTQQAISTLFTSKDVISLFREPTVTPVDSKSKKEENDHGHLDTNALISIIVGVLAFTVCIVTLMFYCKKRKQRHCNNCREGMQLACVRSNPSPPTSRVMNENMSDHTATEEGNQCQPLIVALPSDSPSHQETTTHGQTAASTSLAIPVNTQDNSQTIGAEIELFEWFEHHFEVKETICAMLDTKKSFADVARHYKMAEIKINKLVDRPGEHPTQDVLEFVKCSCNPGILISEFLDCTDSISRKDVSKKLKEALAQA